MAKLFSSYFKYTLLYFFKKLSKLYLRTQIRFFKNVLKGVLKELKMCFNTQKKVIDTLSTKSFNNLFQRSNGGPQSVYYGTL